MGRKARPLLERLMEKVRVTDAGCWEWVGAPDTSGYGRISRGGGEGVSRNVGSGPVLCAHRVSYELHVGPIPAGLQIDHLCRNRRCINPDHLEPISQRENILRGVGVTAINASKTECDYGHPLSGGNLIIERSGRRRCRACYNAAKRAARAKAGVK